MPPVVNHREASVLIKNISIYSSGRSKKPLRHISKSCLRSLDSPATTVTMSRQIPTLLRTAARAPCSSLSARAATPVRSSISARQSALLPSTRGFASEATPSSSGISFQLSEDSEALQDLARKFTAEHIIPKAKHHDETSEYPWDIIKSAHSVGLLNTHIPEEFGGPGLSLMDCSLISEELAYGCSGIQTAIEANGLAEAPVIVAGNKEQKAKYLGRMCEEPLVASYCVVSECCEGSRVQIT